jgi:hypothetical protein
MKIAIMGDSFTHTYKDTWIEMVVNQCNLTLSSTVGFSGMSQYTIYKHFLTVVDENPDIIICCHTEYSRLYNSKFSLIANIVNDPPVPERNFPKDLVHASIEYYKNIYDDDYHKTIYTLIIEKMQKICKNKNIKMVNIPCFQHDFIEKNYGLWISTPHSGLVIASHADHKGHWDLNTPDIRLNHFSPNGHQIIAQNIIPHIKTYITTDQEFHISLLYPEIFA